MYQCTFCSAIFSSNSLLLAHEERHRRLYPCRVCKKHYPTRFSLFRHAKREGHYINQTNSGALPVNHHVPFKGKAMFTKPAGQFGVSKQQPPKKFRELSTRQIIDIYRPRRCDTRVIDYSRSNSTRPSNTASHPPTPPALRQISNSRIRVERKRAAKKTPVPRASTPMKEPAAPANLDDAINLDSSIETIQECQPSTSDGRRRQHTTKFIVIDSTDSDSE